MRCPNCNGEGYIIYETGVYDHGYAELAQDYCPDCEGTGIKKEENTNDNNTSTKG